MMIRIAAIFVLALVCLSSDAMATGGRRNVHVNVVSVRSAPRHAPRGNTRVFVRVRR